MVIGNGMIANRFTNYKDDKEIVIFASGVSNSKNINKENFKKEFLLLEDIIKANPDKVITYFSTCSIYDPELKESPYILHKIQTEDFIQQHASRFHIFRISNVAGISNNPYTLLNNFIFNILQNNPLVIWKNAYRNIIGIDEMYTIAHAILQKKLYENEIINIANSHNYPVPYIIKKIEEHVGKKAVYTEVDKGRNYNIDINAINPILDECGINFPDDYLAQILKKYYRSR